jgi:long-subunit fatty acid transport protein
MLTDYKITRSKNSFSCLPVWIWAACLLFQWTARADIPAAFVDIGYGARPMGMGGAFTAVAADANAIFWNPAGLALLRKNHFTIMHTKQLDLIPYDLGAYAFHAGGHKVGIAFLTSGNDVLRETSLFVSYAVRLVLPVVGRTYLGGNLRYRNAAFGRNEDGGSNRSQGSADGFGVDLGLIYQIGKRTRAGIFCRDMINNMTYHNTTRNTVYAERVPTTLTGGIASQLKRNILLAADFEKGLYSDAYNKIHVGGDLKLISVLHLRSGLWQNIAKELNRNYSLGFGIEFVKSRLGVQFDFAYLINDLANSPRISLSLWH